jgi:hypothetical protein
MWQQGSVAVTTGSSRSYSGLVADPIGEINDCRSLFLADIQEMGRNSLQIAVAEGLPAGPPASIEVGGTIIRNRTPIEATDERRVFEIVWRSYVGYAVLNESYSDVSDEERYEGTRFRIYSKSRFIEYMSRTTFASDKHPGPTRHYCLACEDHILNVLSVEAQAMRRVR